MFSLRRVIIPFQYIFCSQLQCWISVDGGIFFFVSYRAQILDTSSLGQCILHTSIQHIRYVLVIEKNRRYWLYRTFQRSSFLLFCGQTENEWVPARPICYLLNIYVYTSINLGVPPFLSCCSSTKIFVRHNKIAAMQYARPLLNLAAEKRLSFHYFLYLKIQIKIELQCKLTYSIDPIAF